MDDDKKEQKIMMEDAIIHMEKEFVSKKKLPSTITTSTTSSKVNKIRMSMAIENPLYVTTNNNKNNNNNSTSNVKSSTTKMYWYNNVEEKMLLVAIFKIRTLHCNVKN